MRPEGRPAKGRVDVVMPGRRLWQPPVGLVVLLPRCYYEVWDHAFERIAVVVAVQQAAGVAFVVTRTTQPARGGDVPHGADLALGCDKPGCFQPTSRSYRVPFAAFDDPDTLLYGSLPPAVLAKVIEGWERL